MNPYMIGDKAIHPDRNVYESTINNNVQPVEDYPQGWQLVEEENTDDATESVEEPKKQILEFAQPNATNPYMTGDNSV